MSKRGVRATRPAEGATVRSTRNQLHGPFLMLNRITYPDGVVHLMVKACTPASVDNRERARRYGAPLSPIHLLQPRIVRQRRGPGPE